MPNTSRNSFKASLRTVRDFADFDTSADHGNRVRVKADAKARRDFSRKPAPRSN